MDTESKKKREKKGRDKWRGGLKEKWTLRKKNMGIEGLYIYINKCLYTCVLHTCVSEHE